uniref:Uncharacterized protein n=1 Tax=Aegilops tauschii subsp. strangulata TaxID=200361 RepID=A0A452YBC9_AEGTS
MKKRDQKKKKILPNFDCLNYLQHAVFHRKNRKHFIRRTLLNHLELNRTIKTETTPFPKQQGSEHGTNINRTYKEKSPRLRPRHQRKEHQCCFR